MMVSPLLQKKINNYPMMRRILMRKATVKKARESISRPSPRVV